MHMPKPTAENSKNHYSC